uniref:Uncharacterized protein n=1 Tax=Siphoviridae sp. ctL0q1 TaxID=2825449 RepID=A0A8S5PIP1_9CAUD|nr:MAG TPA: hypothetical protein [Siphoviridae sp. ctL0q1]
MSYTFEITDKDGNCTEYKNIQKACYTIPVPNAKETVVEGDDLFSHRYKTYIANNLIQFCKFVNPNFDI